MLGTLSATRAAAHAACRLCGRQAAGIPQLDFRAVGEDRVVADIRFDGDCQGYEGHAHGGIAAAICDAAMCNALFAQGIIAYTARLELRYRRPLRLDSPARVEAHFAGCRGGAWQTSACIHQGGPAVEAEAIFLPIPEPR